MSYDVFFLSYDEPNADQNWNVLVKLCSRAIRISGINGIVEAHSVCAKNSITKSFFVVDADSEVVETFDFEKTIPDYDSKYVHLWKSINPVNQLSYGYGGIKLLSKNMFRKNIIGPDMTTSLGEGLKLISEIGSISRFNSDPYRSWRGGFRECAKLANKLKKNPSDYESERRLYIWTNTISNEPFSEWCLKGALSGKEYGFSNDNIENINNYNWLKEEFKKSK